MNKRKLMLSLVALVGFGSFVTLNAFKSSQKTLSHYRYLSNSTSNTDLHNINNWEEVPGLVPSCGNTGNLVCQYDFDGDINAFENFISDKDLQFLNDNAVSKKQ